MTRYSQAAASGEPGQQVINEFKLLVRECHKRGIEVIMDVVFNHTFEGNEKGPVLSMRCAMPLHSLAVHLQQMSCSCLLAAMISSPEDDCAAGSY